MLRSLICEGDCNPQFAKLEADVSAFRRFERANGHGHIPVDDTLAAELRMLRHTPHKAAGMTATCTECGTWRRYG